MKKVNEYYRPDFYDPANDEDRFEEVAHKSVLDSDGFSTDYTMYFDHHENKYVFVFGDSDLYRPEDGDYDWECDSYEEAEEWFDDYTGPGEDDVDSWMDECYLTEADDINANIMGDEKPEEKSEDKPEPKEDKKSKSKKDEPEEEFPEDDIPDEPEEEKEPEKFVKVTDGNKVVFQGKAKDEPMKDEHWVHNNKDNCDYLEINGKKLKKVEEEPKTESIHEGLDDIHKDFESARENWSMLDTNIDFDSALEQWNEQSSLADPMWYAKPIYSEDAWKDMIDMFSKPRRVKESLNLDDVEVPGGKYWEPGIGDEQYYKVVGYEPGDAETGINGDKFYTLAVVQAFDKEEALELLRAELDNNSLTLKDIREASEEEYYDYVQDYMDNIAYEHAVQADNIDMYDESLKEDARDIEIRYDVVLISADTYKGKNSYSYYDVFDNARYFKGKKYFTSKESAIKQADRLYNENKDDETQELDYVVRELKVKPMTRVADKELDSKIIYNASKNSKLQLTEDTIKTKDGKSLNEWYVGEPDIWADEEHTRSFYDKPKDWEFQLQDICDILSDLDNQYAIKSKSSWGVYYLHHEW